MSASSGTVGPRKGHDGRGRRFCCRKATRCRCLDFRNHRNKTKCIRIGRGILNKVVVGMMRVLKTLAAAVLISVSWSVAAQTYSSSTTIDLEVLGWSKNGKVALVNSNRDSKDYFIIDLVSDKVVWSDSTAAYDETLPNIPFASYGIAEQKQLPTNFPLVDAKLGSYTATLSKINEDGNGSVTYRAQVVKAGKSKILGEFKSGGFRATGNTKALYVRSPFENRILVIAAVEYLHPEFDYEYYELYFLGSHLQAGF